MKDTVSCFDAKTHFSKLIREVELGKKYTILRHDKPVALIVPVESTFSNINDTIEHIKFFSKSRLLGCNVKELSTIGRK